MTKKAEPLGEIGGFMFDVDGTLILSDRSSGQATRRCRVRRRC